MQNEQTLRQEIAEIEERKTALVNEAAEASAQVTKAKQELVEGKAKSADAVAKHTARHEAINQAINTLNGQITEKQNQITALHAAIQREAYLDKVAGIAKDASEDLKELQEAIADADSAIQTHLLRIQALTDSLHERRTNFLAIAGEAVPDIGRPILSFPDSHRQRFYNTFYPLRDEMAQRNVDLRAVLQPWKITDVHRIADTSEREHIKMLKATQWGDLIETGLKALQKQALKR